jgi:hypothetical protein
MLETCLFFFFLFLFFIDHNPTNDPMIIQTDNFWSVVIDFVGSDNVGPGRMLRAHNPQVGSFPFN